MSGAKKLLSDSTQWESSSRGLGKDLSALSPRFSLLQELKSANRARYFLAKDHTRTANQLVRLGVFSAEAVDEPGDLLAFLVEAHAAATLAHKNIAASNKPEQLEGIHFYVSQHPEEARTLGDLLAQKGWFEVPAFLKIAAQLAAALHYAHQLEVLHLKLQPADVLVDEEHTVTVMGFGIPNSPSRRWAQQKRSQECPLTYRSPEQLNNDNVDGRSDLFALGVLLYEMLTDMQPFYAEQENQLRQKIALQKAPAVHLIRPDIPESISAIVAKLLAANPAQRFQDAAALRVALAQVADRPAQVMALQTEPTTRQTTEESERPALAEAEEPSAQPAACEVAAPDESLSLVFHDVEVLRSSVKEPAETLAVVRPAWHSEGLSQPQKFAPSQNAEQALTYGAAGAVAKIHGRGQGWPGGKALSLFVLAIGVLMITAIAVLAFAGHLKTLVKPAAIEQADLPSESIVTPVSEEAAAIPGEAAADAGSLTEPPAAAPEAGGTRPPDTRNLVEPGRASAIASSAQPGRPDTTKLRQQLRRTNQAKVAKQKIRKSHAPAKTRKAKARRGFAKLRFW